MIYIKRQPNCISDGFKILGEYKQYMVSSWFNFDELHLQFPRENLLLLTHMDWKLKLQRRCSYNKTTSQACYMYFTIQYISIGKQTDRITKERKFSNSKSTLPVPTPPNRIKFHFITVSDLKGGAVSSPEPENHNYNHLKPSVTGSAHRRQTTAVDREDIYLL